MTYSMAAPIKSVSLVKLSACADMVICTLSERRVVYGVVVARRWACIERLPRGFSACCSIFLACSACCAASRWA